MSCKQKLAHNLTSQGNPYNLYQATARNQGCNTAQCAPYKTDLVPIVIVVSPIRELSTANLTTTFTVNLPAGRRQPLISPPLILPVPLLFPRLPALRASHRVGRGSLARCAAVGALVMAKLHLQIHGPPPLRVRRLQIEGSIDEIRSGLGRMTSCCRATKFPARFLSFSAIRFASHRGLEAVPRSTTG